MQYRCIHILRPFMERELYKLKNIITILWSDYRRRLDW
jgi:hypothetical protein